MTGESNYLELLQGVAFYDSRGLPQKLLTLEEHSIYWTEQAFQAIGLQKFIAGVLNLPLFSYGSLVTEQYTIVLVARDDSYIACVKANQEEEIDRNLTQWLQKLSLQTIENHGKFVNL